MPPDDYWLFFHPYVYLSVKKSRAILYNTLNHNLLEYESGSPVYSLIKRLNSDSSLYVIRLKGTEITGAVGQFVKILREQFFGDTVDTTLSEKKPVQLKPVLNLQKTMEGITIDGEKSKSLYLDETPDYLNEVTLYLNNNCLQSCSLCRDRDAFKQFPCCNKNNGGNKQLAVDDVKTLLTQAGKSNLHKLNINGGNLLAYPDLEELIKLLNPIPVLKTYFLHYLNIEEKDSFFNLLKARNNQLTVTVHFPSVPAIPADKIKLLEQVRLGRPPRFQLVVQKEEDFETGEAFVSKFGIENFRFVPYYNGKNLDFFKKHIFLDRESIRQGRPKINDILARTVLNTAAFKKLTILSDKSVYAGLNHPKIGKLGKVHIMDMIYNELNKGKSWTRVRKNVSQCKSCAFHALCPPISEYEYAIGKYNLCNIAQ